MSSDLTDEQLKEFDAYLNGTPPAPSHRDNPMPVDEPVADLPKPERTVVENEDDIAKVDDDYLDEIVKLHNRKANDILTLLDKINARDNKDLVADLVDEMQYQNGVVKREKDQLNKLRNLFEQAANAAK